MLTQARVSKEGAHKGNREGALGGVRGEEPRHGAAAHGGRRWRDGAGHGKRSGLGGDCGEAS